MTSKFLSRIPFVFILLAISSLFFSCADNGTLKKIPADADWVAYADFRKIALQSFSLKDIFSFKQKSGEKGSEETLEQSGIDFLSKGIAFGKTKEDGSQSFYFLIPLTDESGFRDFCLSKGKWKQDEGELGKDWLRKDGSAMLIREKMAAGILETGNASNESIRKEIEAILLQDEESGLLKTSDNFKTLVKEEKSIGFWANLQHFAEESNILIPADFLKGEVAGSVDFRTGELLVDGRMIRPISDAENNEKQTELLEKPIDQKFLENCLKGTEAASFFAINISLPSLFAMARKSPFGESLEPMLAQYGLNVSSLVKDLSGEIALSAKSEDPNKTSGFRLMLGCNNKAGIVNQLQAAGQIQKSQGDEFRMVSLPDFRVLQRENTIEITNQNPDGKQNPSNDPLVEFLQAEPSVMLGVVEFDGLTKNLPLPGLEKASGEMWKNLSFRVRRPNPGEYLMNLRLQCRNEEQNSLRVLMDNFKQVNDQSESKRSGNEEAPPPVF